MKPLKKLNENVEKSDIGIKYITVSSLFLALGLVERRKEKKKRKSRSAKMTIIKRQVDPSKVLEALKKYTITDFKVVEDDKRGEVEVYFINGKSCPFKDYEIVENWLSDNEEQKL